MSLTDKQLVALDQIAAAAVDCERATGIPAELTTAQCILESGWLTVAPKNNCFGIKHTSGPDNYCLTSEFLNGKWEKKQLDFQAYPSLQACFAAHAELLKGGPYAVAWLEFLADHQLDSFMGGVAKRYATDPAYFSKIQLLAHSPSIDACIRKYRRAQLT